MMVFKGFGIDMNPSTHWKEGPIPHAVPCDIVGQMGSILPGKALPPRSKAPAKRALMAITL
jgi:hypothetical protein